MRDHKTFDSLPVSFGRYYKRVRLEAPRALTFQKIYVSLGTRCVNALRVFQCEQGQTSLQFN